jgi:hypothetical protein
MPEFEELKKLIEETQKDVRSLSAEVFKLRRRMFWSMISGYFKLAIILIPIILSYWFFQPQINLLLQSWEEVSGSLESLRQIQGTL